MNTTKFRKSSLNRLLNVEWMSHRNEPDSGFHAFEVVNGAPNLTSVCGPPHIERTIGNEDSHLPAYERISDDRKCKPCLKRVK